MSNTNLTADIVAKEAVTILANDCLMANLVYRGLEDEFEKKVNGYEVGDTVSMRRPTDFTVRTGATAAIQDVVEGKTSLTVDTQIGVDFKFSSVERTLKIDELSERVIRPAMVQLIDYIDRDLLSLYKYIPNHVTIPSGGIDSFADFALAGTRADLTAMPSEGRKAILNPTDHALLVGSQTALYIQEPAKGAYREGRLGMINDFETFKSNNIPNHLTGARTGTDVTDFTGTSYVTTGHLWADVKNSTSVTIHIDGMASDTAGYYKAGDTFTIADVYDVNPVSKETLPHLKMFTVMADVTSASNEADLTIWPPIILSGAQKTCHLATGTIEDNTVTYQGDASTSYRQNLFFHRNAFALAMVPMVSPEGAVDVGRRSYKGFSVRVIPYYDGTNDVSNWRLDLLYGKKVIDPRLAIRASLAADI